MCFTDAMKTLLKGNYDSEGKAVPEKKPENRRLLLPEKSETSDEVIAYLTGRGIDKDLSVHLALVCEKL